MVSVDSVSVCSVCGLSIFCSIECSMFFLWALLNLSFIVIFIVNNANEFTDKWGRGAVKEIVATMCIFSQYFAQC